MLKVITTKSFDRDIKKIIKRHKDIEKLNTIVDLLAAGKPLPEKNLNHKLKGEFVGHWECHVEPDWLLVYRKTEAAIILVGTGSHADLF